MKIIGIDPGLQKTGWGIVEQQGYALRFIASGLIKTVTADGLPLRLAHLQREMTMIIEQFRPDCAAVEETFMNNNAASALKLGQARGVLLCAPALCGIPVAEYSTNLVKKSVVGTGHAAKDQIGMMVRTLLPACGKVSEDEADALAVAITHAHYGASAHKLARAGL